MYQARDIPAVLGEHTNRFRILIVDRDSDSANAVRETIASIGATVTVVYGVDAARTAIDRDLPHLVILDWELPPTIKQSLIGQISRQTPARRSRVLALSIHAGEEHIVSGFELGIDDYIVKPYSPLELIARVKAVLRTVRPSRESDDQLEFHRLHLDVVEWRLTIAYRAVPLAPMQLRLLEFLMRHPERVFSRDHLLRQVWRRKDVSDRRAVDINIQRIRKALGPYGCDGYIQTVHSVGYRLSTGLESHQADIPPDD